MESERISADAAGAFFPGCPPFRVVRGRGRCVRLRISEGSGLVVSLPPGFAMRDLPEILRARQEWICRHWSGIAQRRGTPPEGIGEERGKREWNRGEWPACLDFPCTGEHFGIRYEKGESPQVRESPGVVTVRHAGSWETARAALALFLKRHAGKRLAPLLLRLAEENGLPRPARVSVRCQRSRWGSRSTSGTISLNACLLFLPEADARYVLLHELCHERHMDHSEKFWSLLEGVLPGARARDRRLAHGWSQVPRWFLPL